MPPLRLSRATAYLRTGKNTEALADADKAVELMPNVVPAYGVRSSVHEKLGQRDEAIADYKKGL